MVKRRATKTTPRGPMLVGIALAAAVLLFVVGELFAWATSDAGRVPVWRWAHLGDRPKVVRVIGRHIEEGLSRAGIAREAIAMEVVEGPEPRVHWKVVLPRSGAPTLVNHLVTRAVEGGGAQVLSGRESLSAEGAQVVTLLVGVPDRPTHELTIVRPGRRDADAAEEPARLALVLFASAEDESLLVHTCARRETFAVATVAKIGRAHV